MGVERIFLVGPMGVGKSTIGRLLAARLQFDFVDTDQLIEHRCGADIAWIFDVEGESGFRDRETAVLAELCTAQRAVIATGGGIIVREQNRCLLDAQNPVVYLQADIDQLCARTARDRKRPLLQVEDPRQKIIELLTERSAFYERVADFIVNTDTIGPRAAVHKIMTMLQESPNEHA